MFFFNFWDGLFPVLTTLIFAAVITVFIVTIVRGLREWNSNNRSPVLEVEAGVVAKRADVSHTMHSTGDAVAHTTSSTTYYITFQVHSGDRMELRVSGRDYGQIVEGDFGMLTFQGTRFLGFRRT
ncbi:MAG: DUF2500 domain-containing protein [Clostridiales bacterium]|nr:DUF2500 domain-containing protein [Clostridiales bacterium]